MVSRGKKGHRPVWVFVEGGGDSRAQQTRLREGFTEIFAKVLGPTMKPAVIACGARESAFAQWREALLASSAEVCILLVDSEGPVDEGIGPWAHVQRRQGDGWEKPARATEDDLHFMVQAMEAWFFADPKALERYYGKDFQPSALPARNDIENIPKQDLKSALKHAARNTKKGGYDETHGFTLIGLVDPTKLRAASPWAARFFDHLLAVCPAR